MDFSRAKRAMLFFFLILSLTGLACNAVTASPEPSPFPTWTPVPPTALPLETPLPTPAGAPATLPPGSNPQALAACPLDEQSRSMRSGITPDWKKTEINACYDLSIGLNADGSAYTGSEKLSFTNAMGVPLTELVFRTYPNASVIYGGKLTVSAAKVDGQTVEHEVFLRDQTGLRLKLVSPLEPGASTVIEMQYGGQLPTDFNSGNGYGIFERSTLKNGAGFVVTLANFYPILAQWTNGRWVATEVIGGGDAVVSSVSLYQVHVQAPAGWKVAATGSQIGTRNESGGAWLDYAGGPVREFILVASPALEARQVQSGDITITHWGLPGTEKNWDEALKIAKNSVALYTQRYGEYPYKELDVVSVPLRYASGVEYPGLVLIETGQYGNSGQPGLELATVISHEIAHQWWYGVVGSDVLEHPFQDEALATYSELVYEQKYNPVVYRGELAIYRADVKSVEDHQGKKLVDQSVAAFNGDDNAYAAIVYLKGALFYQALRDQLGDDAFFQALQIYYQNNAFTTADVNALFDSFEQGCRCDPSPIFEEYGVEQ
ncbi:MAG TPA: M1 family aminopeptidase [Anaerolineaceae bacterium]|nr:M1 family aminopeptidase [Anaerolineaceae bacterium]